MKDHPHLTPEISAYVADMYGRVDESTFLTPDLMKGCPPAAENLVTYANWMTAPYNRWGMHNVRNMAPSTPVKRGQAISELPQTDLSKEIEGLMFPSIGGGEQNLLQHLHVTRTDAFVVMQNGRLLYENYFNGQQPDDCHIMFSVTKSLTGVLLETLIYENRLDESAAVESILPELKGSAFSDACIRDMLNMAVGIDYVEDYNDPDSTVCQFFYVGNYKKAPKEYPNSSSMYEFLPTLKKKGEHGNLFHYVTAVTEVLGWVFERISDKTPAKAMSEIWQALGCEEDAFFLTDNAGRCGVGAGFNATARDMARYTSMIANKGEFNGKQIVPAAVVENIAAGANPEVFATDSYFNFWLPGASYKSQWYVYNDEFPCMLGSGIHGQYIFIDFKSGTVIVKQSSLPTAEPKEDTDTPYMFRTLARMLDK